MDTARPDPATEPSPDAGCAPKHPVFSAHLTMAGACDLAVGAVVGGDYGDDGGDGGGVRDVAGVRDAAVAGVGFVDVAGAVAVQEVRDWNAGSG